MKLLRFVLVIVLVLIGAIGATAADAVRFAFAVSQRDSAKHADVPLYVDTAVIVNGIPATGFMAVMSVEIRVKSIDTSSVTYQVSAVTAIQPASTASREISSEFDLPLKIADLAGKNNARYTLTVKPLKRIKVDDQDCAVANASFDRFYIDPTAHTDLFYVKNSHGDYYWNVVKGLFESEYDQFDGMNKFNVPGKYSIYLCPCPIASVIWDDRFGQVIDPTRGCAFTVFTTSVNTADPFVLMLLASYRQYGYAPAFLADGLANFSALAVDEMQAIVKEGKNKPLASLMDTYTYYTSDPRVSDETSACFVKYLVFKYSLDRFLTAYKQADDLNLQATIEKVYQKPLADLESEWLSWLSKLTLRAPQYEYYAEKAEAMFDYRQMLKYAKLMQSSATTRNDSVLALPLVTRASFNTGDYYGATDAQRRLSVYDTTGEAIVALAGYQMMNGLYDSARADLLRRQQRDTSNQLIKLNLGMNRLFTGDTAGATEILEPIATQANGPGVSEAKVMLGLILLRSREQAKHARAVPLFQEAVTVFQSRVGTHNVLPTEQMWLGIAFLGLDDQSNALSSLQMADFLESRPFYRGIIRLWLGKAADLRGERDVALSYYNSVLSNASAHYTQQEARQYLKTPYTQ